MRHNCRGGGGCNIHTSCSPWYYRRVNGEVGGFNHLLFVRQSKQEGCNTTAPILGSGGEVVSIISLMTIQKGGEGGGGDLAGLNVLV